MEDRAKRRGFKSYKRGESPSKYCRYKDRKLINAFNVGWWEAEEKDEDLRAERARYAELRRKIESKFDSCFHGEGALESVAAEVEACKDVITDLIILLLDKGVFTEKDYFEG